MRTIVGILSALLLVCLSGPAGAQRADPAVTAEVRELLRLLNEPSVRSWLTAELKNAPAARPAEFERSASSPSPRLLGSREPGWIASAQQFPPYPRSFVRRPPCSV